MNYTKIYNNIIERAKNRVNITEQYDIHHIIPKSLGGLDNKDNLIKLTLREHFICHLLLAKIYGKGMLHAALMMSSFKRYNSRKFKWVKEKYITNCLLGDNNPAKRIPTTPQKRQKCSETSKDRKWINNGTDSCMSKGEHLQELLSSGWILGRLRTPSLIAGTKLGGKKTGGHNKGIPMSTEQKIKLSIANTGKVSPLKGKSLSPETIEKMRKQRLGKKHSTYSKIKMSNSAKGVHLGKKYINKDGIVKHVKPEVLQSYINDGWILGNLRKKRSLQEIKSIVV